ncbi:MAG: protein tyrosine phosphatase [Kofleriaceae bacterium]|nr:protein tyrosine phosphatase [Kofleriaceae bacterium]
MRYIRPVVGFVDLHSHVLSGLDDGARDLATSRAMLTALEALGFSEVYATPHQKAGQFLPGLDAIDAAFAQVQALAVPGLRLGLAAENMWDDVFFDRLQRGQIPSYDRGDVFLVELRPHELPLGLVDQLFRLRMAGKTPVLAHPERYEPLWADDGLIERLRAHCGFVCDLGAVAGYHGKQPQKMARRLLEEGVAAAVASDAHTVEDVRAAAEGIAWIAKRLGQPAVVRLLDDGPRALLAGELPE